MQDFGQNTVIGKIPEGWNITFSEQGASEVHIGEGCTGNLNLNIRGQGCTVEIGKDCKINGNISMTPGAQLKIGDRLRCNGRMTMNIAHADAPVFIGNDCLFANPYFRAWDSHYIFDQETDELLNPPAPIILHDKVWLGHDVLVLKGAEIGENSVIGARAVVNGKIQANCIAGGTPAKVLKTGTYWRETLKE